MNGTETFSNVMKLLFDTRELYSKSNISLIHTQELDSKTSVSLLHSLLTKSSEEYRVTKHYRQPTGLCFDIEILTDISDFQMEFDVDAKLSVFTKLTFFI